MSLVCSRNSNRISHAALPIPNAKHQEDDAGAEKPRPMSISIRAQAYAPLSPPDAPLVKLYQDLTQLFTRVKTTFNCEINRFQPEDSFKVLDAGVRSLIGKYIAAGHADWRKFVGFNPLHYVRHLVDANDDFELIILCWQPGQKSRIHDHYQAHGYVTVLDGVIEEQRYTIQDLSDDDENEGQTAPESLAASPPKNIPNTLSAARPCPRLNYTGTLTANRGSGSLYINDGIGLHLVSCPVDCPPAVTLHLYSPPIHKVKLFDPAENKVVNRVPGYYSIRGQRV